MPRETDREKWARQKRAQRERLRANQDSQEQNNNYSNEPDVEDPFAI